MPTPAPKNSPINAVLFPLVRWLTLVVAVAAIAAAAIALAMAASTLHSSGLEVPIYGQQSDSGDMGGIFPRFENSAAKQKEKLQLSSQYGEQILGTITQYKITAFTTDNMIDLLLANVPDEYRSAFLAGWAGYLKSGMAALGDNGRPDRLTREYRDHFMEALGNIASQKAAKAAQRYMLMGVAGGALTLFLLAILIPLLVAIERNTRLAAAAAGMPARPAEAKAAAKCPKCKAPTAPGDTFCGSCGASLS
jgi:hypothetical protein